MSAECGLCEVHLRQTELIAKCDEPDCPQRRPLKLNRPLSQLSYREMATIYGDEEGLPSRPRRPREGRES